MSLDKILRSMQVAADYWLVSDTFAAVEGFLDPIEGYALLLLAEHGPGQGSIVEIGSFAGRSTSYLACGSKRARREKVVAVDHFEGSPEHRRDGAFETSLLPKGGSLYETFRENLRKAGLDDWVHIMRAGSREAVKGWNRPIRLLFIDGDHSFEASQHDYEAWSPWLAQDGLAAFHDIGIFPGVTKYYEELLGRGEVVEVLSTGTLRVATKAA
ncbi:class I SAM-dependent methyltransferase [Solidesulfovibrio magneticus]|uniref:O-methyltransferase n=1 Tax=Solidesulfovibrio magneticus (strain ATCC 700980 / DSM 13731 / RS-1) TaxID=573370 RepID=C4XK35_SOLM1|nr:class I SAM-dependent methyltransferase [Solidesulfovibrio magneticus]BAH74390.1 hypothetical protein DMR_08990 [Solidesulfovibrio magneticus RS-1]